MDTEESPEEANGSESFLMGEVADKWEIGSLGSALTPAQVGTPLSFLRLRFLAANSLIIGFLNSYIKLHWKSTREGALKALPGSTSGCLIWCSKGRLALGGWVWSDTAARQWVTTGQKTLPQHGDIRGCEKEPFSGLQALLLTYIWL